MSEEAMHLTCNPKTWDETPTCRKCQRECQASVKNTVENKSGDQKMFGNSSARKTGV